ncbi:MAG: hypothetical protein RLZZ453_738 [Chlamydiota bacterium]|jgi:GlpG protein
MRLIGTLLSEKEAFAFYAFLLNKQIPSIYEPHRDSEKPEYRIWVYDEDDVAKAIEYFEYFKQNPHDAQFQQEAESVKPLPATPAYEEISQKEDLKWQSRPVAPKMRRTSFFLMRLIVALCVLFFLWDDKQEDVIKETKGPIAAEIAMTPLQQEMLFDKPASYQYIEELLDTVPLQGIQDFKQLPVEATDLLKKAEAVPAWHGLIPFIEEGMVPVPMFQKISQGEVWRLFTPCLLHRDFLHILFNMIWAWMLLKQVEARMHRGKILLLVLIIGVISNTAQYLMSGPYFLGFSGVIVGLAAFIWTRQKKAPWEGYTLPRSVAMFLLFFVLAMFAIELFSLLLRLFASVQVVPYIANTAHIVGGLVGLVLGRMAFFGRKSS